MHPSDETTERTADGRPTMNGPSAAYGPASHEAGSSKGSTDLGSAVIRYKWAVILPTLLGFVIGVIAWTQLPRVYESTARLLVESDQPVILDSSTGEVVNGLPGAGVIQAQLYSDKLLGSVWFDDLRMQDEEVRRVIEDEFDGSFALFATEHVVLEPEAVSSKTAPSMSFVLRVTHTSEELVNASAQAINDKLVAYFDARRKDSLDALRDYIEKAMGEYQPELDKLQEEQRNFQLEHQLQFDSEGNAINPHRIRLAELQTLRSRAEDELHELQSQLNVIESTLSNAKDPRVAIDVIGQYLGREILTPYEERRKVGVMDEDQLLKYLDFETDLVPLTVEWKKAVAEYGESHPRVTELRAQVELSKKEFERLSMELTNRIKEVLDNSERDSKEALEAGQALVTAIKAEIETKQLQIADYKERQAIEKKEAEKLSALEQQNAALLLDIAQAEQLLSTLEQQMARVSLADKQAGLSVIPLNRPSQAKIVGPILPALALGGLGLGLVLGIGAAYLLESQAGTFRTAEEVSEFLQAPVLAHVPYYAGRRGRAGGKGESERYADLDDKLAVLHRPSSIVAEAIRACRTALFFEAKTRGSKVIQVTSALPSEGKSVVAGNLAVSIAQAGKRVVLIDGDLRRPQLSDNFALEAENGLTDILNGHCDPTDAIHATSVDNLDVIPAGPIPVNPAEALTLPEVDDLIDWLRERYDFVIIDTPPLLIVTDPSIIAGHVDGVLVTLKVRRKSKHNAREAMGMLRNIGANVVGLVINASDDTSASDGYKGYGYHRFGRHASRYTNESRSSKGASVRGDRPPVVVRGKNGEDRVNGEDGVQLHASSGNGAVGLLEEDDEHRDSDA